MHQTTNKSLIPCSSQPRHLMHWCHTSPHALMSHVTSCIHVTCHLMHSWQLSSYALLTAVTLCTPDSCHLMHSWQLSPYALLTAVTLCTPDSCHLMHSWQLSPYALLTAVTWQLSFFDAGRGQGQRAGKAEQQAAGPTALGQGCLLPCKPCRHWQQPLGGQQV